MAPGSPKSQQYCCCAIGSRDRSISVWLTSLKRPLVVIKDLFDDSVLDISWSSNGLYLFACSWDGSVACVIFEQEEIGIPLSIKEKVSRIFWRSSQWYSFSIHVIFRDVHSRRLTCFLNLLLLFLCIQQSFAYSYFIQMKKKELIKVSICNRNKK
jgi:WD40 repeat protein